MRKDFTNFCLDGLLPKGRAKSMDTPKRKPTKPKQPLTREEELLFENERLRCENALQKKFNALIQTKEETLKNLNVSHKQIKTNIRSKSTFRLYANG
ncbi:hypothetical protein [Flavobacterium sp. I3-2]|uniref:hypothetical protein n=1 Tax=Flavobacterium sp. I3-2 TaxID=2748319 RepID=UPI0015A89C81|nr:hypothetical protein [Flavobacterium sp. I3-2]